MTEPGPLLFSRLLRLAADPDALLFGHDVGPGVLPVLPQPIVEVTAVRALDVRPVPQPANVDKHVWLSDHMKRHGVLTAWPAAASSTERAAARICVLSQRVAAGHATWWLHNLRRSLFSRNDSYATSIHDTVTSTLRLGGGPAVSFDFFPSGAVHGLGPGIVGAYLHFGLAVRVDELPAAEFEPVLHVQVRQCEEALALRLEAASHGLSPAVIAAMLVFDSDDYAASAHLTLPADAAVISNNMTGSEATRVRAMVTVAQQHTFRLSDMLQDCAVLPHRRMQVVSALGELLHKLRLLSDLRIVHWGISPLGVVFCPELVADGDKDWKLQGISMDGHIKGHPFIWDFDTRLCKRIAQHERMYDPDCAFAVMTLVLLASTHTQCPAAYELVLEAVAANEQLASVLERVSERADTFVDLLRRTFQHSRRERDPLPSSVVEETVADCRYVLRAGKGALARAVGFGALMAWLHRAEIELRV